MTPGSLQTLYQKIARTNPDLIKSGTVVYDQEFLRHIGVILPPYIKRLNKAFIKLYSEDFVVEEIDQWGDIARVDEAVEFEKIYLNPLKSKETPKEGNHYLCLMIKKGLGHRDAMRKIGSFLNIPIHEIKTAGLKDKQALTAQKISIATHLVPKPPLIQRPELTLIALRRIKEPIYPGNLKGNFFTITCRTPQTVRSWDFHQQVMQFQKNGFLNFYGPQRFSRNLSTQYAAYEYIKGDLEEGLKKYLCTPGYSDSPIVNQIRKVAEEKWRDWDTIIEYYKLLPQYLHVDLNVLKILKATQGNFKKAILSDQTYFQIQMWAFSSYLFNRLLSDLARAKPLNPQVSLPIINREAKNLELYASYLKEMGCDDPAELLNRDTLPMFQLSNQERPVRAIVPFIGKIRYQMLKGGVRVGFGLPRGSYATSFLMQLFELNEGEPAPDWVVRDRELAVQPTPGARQFNRPGRLS